MEIELYSKLQNPIEAIDRIGEFFAKSTMFGCDRVEQGKVLAMACLTENKSPIQVNREYHILGGNIADRAEALYAKFLANGGKRKIISRTSELASVELTAKDGQMMTFSLSWEDAQKEPFVKAKSGGLKTNWATPRARMQMLWARVISDGVRTLAPEIPSCVFTAEEIQDEISSRAPSLELQPSSSQPTPAATEPKPANVVSVSTANPDEKAEAAMGLAPSKAVEVQTEAKPAETKPESKPFQSGPQYQTPEGKTLPADLESQVTDIIMVEGGPGMSAINWIVKEGWLQEGQPLRCLTEARARRIIKNKDTFLKVVKEANL